MESVVYQRLFGLFVSVLFLSQAASAYASPAMVDLGAAGDFLVLTYAGITNVPPSAINGNIGAYPIGGSAIGVACEEVNGTIYAADATGPSCQVVDATLLNTAINALGTAYTDANSRATSETNPGAAGEIGGLTLAPGVYTFTGTSINVLISTDLFLDCSGDTNGVFIFQIPGTFGVASGKQVTLSNGCQAKNIFWAVGGATTLYGSSIVNGNILDQTSIAMQDLATLNGRAMSQTESVTLIANTVLLPADATDTNLPVVALNSPSAGFNTTNTTTIFNFTATDDVAAMLGCTLSIDGVSNETNSSVENGVATIFTVQGIPEGAHNWSVGCSDPSGNMGHSSVQIYTIDTVNPSLSVSTVSNAVSSNISFMVNASGTGTGIRYAVFDIYENAGMPILVSSLSYNATSGLNTANCTTVNITDATCSANPSIGAGNFFLNVTAYDAVGLLNSSVQYFNLTATNESVGNFYVTPSSFVGGTVNGSAYNVTLPANMSIVAAPNADYAFGNWTLSGNCSVANASAAATTATLLSGDCSAEALFVAIPKGSLILSASTGGAVSGTVYNVILPANASITATPGTGFSFENWTLFGNCSVANASEEATIATLLSGNCNAHALFAVIPVNITNDTSIGSLLMVASAGGAVSGSVYNISLPAAISIYATPDEDFSFESWTLFGNCSVEDASAASTTATLLSGNCSADALFMVTPLNTTNGTIVSCSLNSIIGDVNNDGLITHQDAMLTSSVFVEIIPMPANICCIDVDASGYVNSGDSLLIQRYVSGLPNSTLIGSTCSDFYGDFVVFASPVAGGTVTGSANNTLYPITLNVSATPNPGYTFGGWALSGNCSAATASAAATNITLLSGNCNATASFAAVPATPSGGSGGSSSGSGGGSVSGGSGGSSTSSKQTTTVNVDIGLGRFCAVTITREMESANDISTLTTTLENVGGNGCSMTDFVFTDTIPSDFPALNMVTFNPQYASRDGLTVTFAFPTFAAGESKTLTYSANQWIRTSLARSFTAYTMSAKKQEATQPAANATVPEEASVWIPRRLPALAPLAQPAAQTPAEVSTVLASSLYDGFFASLWWVALAILLVLGVIFWYMFYGNKKKKTAKREV